MTAYDTTTPKYADGPSPPGDRAVTVPVLAAVWCRSVGTCWTLELHQLRRGESHTTLMDWISSGVPITQPEPPEALARELLAERRLWLFHDPFAGSWTGTRRGIGYAAGDADLIALAHLVANEATKTGRHPVMLAAQWVAAGFSPEATARWIRHGVHSPPTTQQHTPPPQPTDPPHTTSHSTRAHPPGKPAIAGESDPASPSIQDPNTNLISIVEGQISRCARNAIQRRPTPRTFGAERS